jgi:KipI family sensor histidine kinase inhibitor
MTLPTMSFFLMGENAAVMQPCSPILFDNKHKVDSSTSTINIDCQRKIWAAAHQLRQLSCCVDIVPGMNNLTANFDPLQYSASEILKHIETAWELAQAQTLTPRIVTIPVHYGGEFGDAFDSDLAHVSKHTGLSQEAVIKLHTSAEYVVYFLGFQPGFAYLGGLPEQLATPRRAEPRLRVPAGSVGIGGSQTGIYPADSPGGWQIIGRTKTILFNPQASSPSLLEPGDIVRFVDIRVHE